MAYEEKGGALMALNRGEEARVVLEQALERAKAEDRYGHQTQCLILLGRLEIQNGNLIAGTGYLEQAAAMGSRLNFCRMVADAMFELARAYEQQGELSQAEIRLKAGLDASQRVGDRYYVPRNLTALAELKAREGDVSSAETPYKRAEEVIDGLVIDMPDPYSRSSMIGAVSQTYLRHFELAASLNDVNRAFEILERTRGHTVADFLRAHSTARANNPPGSATIADQISAFQLQLMRSENPEERRDLLENLEEAEVRRAYLKEESDQERNRALFGRPASLIAVQQILKPDELLLEYVLDEPKSYCLTVSRTETRLIALPAGRRQIEERRHRDSPIPGRSRAHRIGPLATVCGTGWYRR
jgi:tetratricopeptide (TPR) repeat protein